MLQLLVLVTALYILLVIVALFHVLGTRDRFLFLPVFMAVGLEAVWHVAPNLGYLMLPGFMRPFGEPQLPATAIGNLVDFVYIIVWSSVFLLIVKALSKNPGRVYLEVDADPLNNPSPLWKVDRHVALRAVTPLLWICVVTVPVFYPVAKVFHWPTGYAAEQPFARLRYAPGEFLILRAVLQRLILLVNPLAITTILLRAEKPLSRKNLVPLIGLVLVSVHGLTQGVRNTALDPAMLLMAAAFVLRRQFRLVAVAAVGFGVFLGVTSSAIQAIRQTTEFSRETTIGGRMEVLFRKDQTSEGGTEASLGRLNKAYYAGLLVDYTNQQGIVGLKPYYAVPFGLIPRRFWEDKPVVGSSTNDDYGLAGFLVSYLATGQWGSSANVGPGGYGYWMGGITGLILLPAFNGAVFAILWSFRGAARHPVWLVVLLSEMGFFGVYYIEGHRLLTTCQHMGVFVWLVMTPFMVMARRRPAIEVAPYGYQDPQPYEEVA